MFNALSGLSNAFEEIRKHSRARNPINLFGIHYPIIPFGAFGSVKTVALYVEEKFFLFFFLRVNCGNAVV